MSETKENISNSTKNSEFTLLDIIVLFLTNKWKVLMITGFFFIVSVILYFFVFDLIYFSSATIKGSSRSSSLLSSLEGGLSDIGGLDDFGLGVGKSAKELATFEQILTSRRCIEPLIDKFGIMDKGDYNFKEDAIKDFTKGQLLINQDKLSSLMEVGVYNKDPKIAREMVDFLLSQLDKINIEMNVQSARNNREFIEKRYIQARLDLTKAEDTLKAFQIVYGVAPDLQVKAAAQSEFTIEAELKTEEVKLDVLRKILSPDEVEVKTQEAKIRSLKNKIQQIQTSTDLGEYIRLGNSPQIVMSFLRLQREIEIQSKIVSFLLPVFEQAKIEEKRETPTIMVLDKPYVAERKTKPKRLTMVLVLTFFGFIVGNLFFVVKNRWLVLSKQIRTHRNN